MKINNPYINLNSEFFSPEYISSIRLNGEPKIKTVKNPVILFITSILPRECGIATYSNDLIKALNKTFGQSFEIQICALENDNEHHQYADSVKYILNTDNPEGFNKLANKINEDATISMVVVQHEFGFFANYEAKFFKLLKSISLPKVIVFHTVLPNPNDTLKLKVKILADLVDSIIVMTNSSVKILVNDYEIPASKIKMIPHGTHLVPHTDTVTLKSKYNFSNRKVLSTFGLLSTGKSIETTLEALPEIIKFFPEIIFLVIGKTHPSVVKQDGQSYRNFLEAKVKQLNLQDHVRFLNYFMPLPELLEYLQLTDIYLFTSKDPNQAVSGTFSYAISCGCPVISTPIPHAMEVLKGDSGIIFDFGNSTQLSSAVIKLLEDEILRSRISSDGLHRMASTAWENSAIAHTLLFEQLINTPFELNYNIPEINLQHIKKLTTDFGMIQFSKINQPDKSSGYTLDDNARALIVMCQHFELTLDENDLTYIRIYLDFINFCLQPEGYFFNYADENKQFTEQNHATNIADSNGRAIWALGYLIAMGEILPKEFILEAKEILKQATLKITKIHSTRAMAFAIKGLYYSESVHNNHDTAPIISELANRLVQMYRHETDYEWQWFESYLTYANSILPDALLCAWKATGDPVYKEIAKTSFDFLISKIFTGFDINVISNRTWMHKGQVVESGHIGGQQPIDVAYTILALQNFYEVFKETDYLDKIKSSFDWFLGRNNLNQVIYNPVTGGCYDGMESENVNLNQGAESTVSYHLARFTLEKILSETSNHKQAAISKNIRLNMVF